MAGLCLPLTHSLILPGRWGYAHLQTRDPYKTFGVYFPLIALGWRLLGEYVFCGKLRFSQPPLVNHEKHWRQLWWVTSRDCFMFLDRDGTDIFLGTCYQRGWRERWRICGGFKLKVVEEEAEEDGGCSSHESFSTVTAAWTWWGAAPTFFSSSWLLFFFPHSSQHSAIKKALNTQPWCFCKTSLFCCHISSRSSGWNVS